MQNDTERFAFSVTKEDLRMLKTLSIKYGETKHDVIKRALIMLYYKLNKIEEINEQPEPRK